MFVLTNSVEHIEKDRERGRERKKLSVLQLFQYLVLIKIFHMDLTLTECGNDCHSGCECNCEPTIFIFPCRDPFNIVKLGKVTLHVKSNISDC